MLSSIIGVFGRPKVTEETRMRNWLAEVADAELRLRARGYYPSATPTIREADCEPAHPTADKPLLTNNCVLANEPGSLYTLSRRHVPGSSCCPHLAGSRPQEQCGVQTARKAAQYSVSSSQPLFSRPYSAAGSSFVALPSHFNTTAATSLNDTAPQVASRNPAHSAIAAEQQLSDIAEDNDANQEQSTTASASGSPADDVILIGRWQHWNNVPIEWLKEKVINDLIGPGAYNFFGTRMLSWDQHPLVQQYNQRRNEAIAAGEPDPGAIELNWSLANRMRKPPPRPFVYRNPLGIEVHRGFPGPVRRVNTPSYSSLHGFVNWRFTDADVNFDTEVTRLKELKIKDCPSHLKLVLASKADPIAGTPAFIEANKTKDEEELKAESYAFEGVIGNPANPAFADLIANASRTIRFDANIDNRAALEGCAIESDTSDEDKSEEDEEDDHNPDDLLIASSAQDVDWNSRVKVKLESKGKQKVPYARKNKFIKPSSVKSEPIGIIQASLASQSDAGSAANDSGRSSFKENARNGKFSKQSTKPSSPPPLMRTNATRRVRFVSPERKS